MKGRLKKIEDKWVVEYSKIKYVGGNPKVLGSYSKKIQVKTLPLLPKNQEYMNRFLYVDNNTKVDFKEVLINPMGREVDPNNLGQNNSGCVWYAELIYDENEEPKFENSIENTINIMDMANSMFGKKQEQKQHLIDMMKGDEELGLYDDILTLKLTKEDARGLLTCIMRTSAKGKDLDVGEMVEEQLVQFLKLK
jgi:hypothetical protein